MLNKSSKDSSVYFACFSPMVMFASFVIEALIGLYIMLRYKWTTIVRLAIVLIFSLATFQLAEYQVCEGNPDHSATWSRIGYVAITLLPVIGVHMMKIMTKSKNKWSLPVAYFSGAAFVTLFAFGDAFSGHSCEGNYVIFQMTPPFGGAYFVYYYLLLLGTIIWAFNAAQTATAKMRETLYLFIIGYFVFMVPTAIITVWHPHTLAGLPSIMCGFAVLFAVLFVLVILPRLQDTRGKKKKSSK